MTFVLKLSHHHPIALSKLLFALYPYCFAFFHLSENYLKLFILLNLLQLQATYFFEYKIQLVSNAQC